MATPDSLRCSSSRFAMGSRGEVSRAGAPVRHRMAGRLGVAGSAAALGNRAAMLTLRGSALNVRRCSDNLNARINKGGGGDGVRDSPHHTARGRALCQSVPRAWGRMDCRAAAAGPLLAVLGTTKLPRSAELPAPAGPRSDAAVTSGDTTSSMPSS